MCVCAPLVRAPALLLAVSAFLSFTLLIGHFRCVIGCFLYGAAVQRRVFDEEHISYLHVWEHHILISPPLSTFSFFQIINSHHGPKETPHRWAGFFMNSYIWSPHRPKKNCHFLFLITWMWMHFERSSFYKAGRGRLSLHVRVLSGVHISHVARHKFSYLPQSRSPSVAVSG